MTISLSPSQSDIQIVLRSFLISILPAGVEVIEGQDNRVPEPEGTEFVVMTPIGRPRMGTNFDEAKDCAFIASISAAVMDVTEMLLGSIALGNTLFGPGVTAGTSILSQASGPPGGIGTYNLSQTQTVASEKMACGSADLTQSTQITIQLDVHSADVKDASDMAQIISTCLRDEMATRAFHALNPAVSPLYADDPKQMPFQNAEQQWETRWVVDAQLQANQTVSGVPQEFADQVTPELICVEATFPAS